MRLFTRRTPRAEPSPIVVTALELARGEQVLSFAVDDITGAHVVATTYAIAVVTPDGQRTSRRRWLSVSTGVWDPDTATLTVTWADGADQALWSMRYQATLLPETVRERVQASVVLSARLNLGDRRSGRVAIRQDFANGELIPQTILGQSTYPDDPEVQAHVRAALAHLKDQVGLPA